MRRIYCTLYYKVFVILLLAHCIVKYGHTWAPGVWLVLGRTSPFCPHAHSRLILITPFCCLDCLQTPSLSFPQVLFGLAVQIQVLGDAGFSLGHTHTRSLWNRLYMQLHKTSNTHVHINNHLNYFALLNPSRRNLLRKSQLLSMVAKCLRKTPC